jgi:hypothetical protein
MAFLFETETGEFLIGSRVLKIKAQNKWVRIAVS